VRSQGQIRRLIAWRNSWRKVEIEKTEA
jgi:hypothetical protein